MPTRAGPCREELAARTRGRRETRACKVNPCRQLPRYYTTRFVKMKLQKPLKVSSPALIGRAEGNGGIDGKQPPLLTPSPYYFLYGGLVRTPCKQRSVYSKCSCSLRSPPHNIRRSPPNLNNITCRAIVHVSRSRHHLQSLVVKSAKVCALVTER